MVKKMHCDKEIIHPLVNPLSDISICVFDSNLRCKLASGTILQLLNLTGEEVLGKPIQEILVPPEAGACNAEKLAGFCQLAIDGTENGLELSINGTQFDAKIVPLLAGEQSSNRAGMIVFRETKGSQNDERFGLLLDSAPDAMVVVNERGKITRVNTLAETLFGHTRNELLGKPIEFLLPERYHSGHTDNQKNYFADPRIRQMGSGLNLIAMRKDGREFPVDISLSPVETEQGMMVVSAIRDITPQKQAELALKAAKDHLETRVKERTTELRIRNEELDAFAQMVAHDLKSPLTYLVGMAGLLHQNYGSLDATEISEHLGSILQQSHKMDSIISELLVLSSVRQLEQPVPEIIDMTSVVIEAQNRLVYLAKEYKAKIITPDYWPTVVGHAAWIEAVWVNYISNALKYGGRPPVVKLGATTQPNGMVRFWVGDNGAGLKPNEQEQLFRPFTRLGNIRVDGHGVGLTIVRRMIEKLGGEVGIESEINAGSVFFFTLPESAS